MTLQSDLLEQAKHLAYRESKRPRQASLRRAVSAAYYSLFHLLIDDASRALTTNSPIGLRDRVRRAFSHSDMNELYRQITKKPPPPSVKEIFSGALDSEIVTVAQAFVDLQQARHRADYDLSSNFARVEVRRPLKLAETATSDWRKVRKAPNAAVFLTALLLHKRWGR